MTSISNDVPNRYRNVTIVPMQAACLLVLAVLWLIAYFSTFEQIVLTWFESTTFEHAVIIAPIAIWLIYRKRYAFGLARRRNIDVILGFAGLLAAVLLFVVGKLSLINALQQFALMSMPLFFVWGIFGFVTLRHLFFPLFFLILSVPFGEFMIPHLQEVTADLTVMMLKVVGVPVYREGWYLQIPEGLFHVAEACSGIRFLFSTITIGLLIAHLEIRSRIKQAVFLACVVVIPILANGMRAFIMVYIGHASNMKAAVGFDHLVYGWVFFFFVTALVLAFSRLFYDEKNMPKFSDTTVIVALPKKRFAAALIVIALGPVFMGAFYSQQTQALEKVSEDGVVLTDIKSLSGWQPIYTGFDEYRFETIQTNEATIILHEITYVTENEEKELVTWNNKPYDPEVWSVAESEARVIDSAQQRFHYKYLQLKNGTGRSIHLVYMWKVGDVYTVNPIIVKGMQVLNKLSLNDFGGVALYAASEGNVSQQSLIEALIKLEQQKSE